MKLPIVIKCPAISDRKLFGLMIIGAYVLSLGTLAYMPIPVENSEYFGQLMIGLVGAVGIIVGAIWKTSASEEKTTTTLQTLVDKVTPPTGDAKDGTSDSTAGAGIGSASSPSQAGASADAEWPFPEQASGLGEEGKRNL